MAHLGSLRDQEIAVDPFEGLPSAAELRRLKNLIDHGNLSSWQTRVFPAWRQVTADVLTVNRIGSTDMVTAFNEVINAHFELQGELRSAVENAPADVGSRSAEFVSVDEAWNKVDQAEFQLNRAARLDIEVDIERPQ